MRRPQSGGGNRSGPPGPVEPGADRPVFPAAACVLVADGARKVGSPASKFWVISQYPQPDAQRLASIGRTADVAKDRSARPALAGRAVVTLPRVGSLHLDVALSGPARTQSRAGVQQRGMDCASCRRSSQRQQRRHRPCPPQQAQRGYETAQWLPHRACDRDGSVSLACFFQMIEIKSIGRRSVHQTPPCISAEGTRNTGCTKVLAVARSCSGFNPSCGRGGLHRYGVT